MAPEGIPRTKAAITAALRGSPASRGKIRCSGEWAGLGAQSGQRGVVGRGRHFRGAQMRRAQFGLLQALSMSVCMYIIYSPQHTNLYYSSSSHGKYIIQPTLIYITPAPAMAKLYSDTCTTRHARRHRYPPGIKASLVLPGCHTHTRTSLQGP